MKLWNYNLRIQRRIERNIVYSTPLELFPISTLGLATGIVCGIKFTYHWLRSKSWPCYGFSCQRNTSTTLPLLIHQNVAVISDHRTSDSLNEQICESNLWIDWRMGFLFLVKVGLMVFTIRKKLFYIRKNQFIQWKPNKFFTLVPGYQILTVFFFL